MENKELIEELGNRIEAHKKAMENHYSSYEEENTISIPLIMKALKAILIDIEERRGNLKDFVGSHE